MISNNLTTFPLYREEIFAVLKDNHPLALKSAIQAEDLMDQPMIIYKAGFEPPVKRNLDPKGHREIHLAVSSIKDSSIAVKLFIRTALQLFENRSRSVVSLQ